MKLIADTTRKALSLGNITPFSWLRLEVLSLIEYNRIEQNLFAHKKYTQKEIRFIRDFLGSNLSRLSRELQVFIPENVNENFPELLETDGK